MQIGSREGRAKVQRSPQAPEKSRFTWPARLVTGTAKPTLHGAMRVQKRRNQNLPGTETFFPSWPRALRDTKTAIRAFSWERAASGCHAFATPLMLRAFRPTSVFPLCVLHRFLRIVRGGRHRSGLKAPKLWPLGLTRLTTSRASRASCPSFRAKWDLRLYILHFHPSSILTARVQSWPGQSGRACNIYRLAQPARRKMQNAMKATILSNRVRKPAKSKI